MGFTLFLALFVLALLIVTVSFVVSGIWQRNRRRIVLPVLIFILLIGGIYWALICLITSM